MGRKIAICQSGEDKDRPYQPYAVTNCYCRDRIIILCLTQAISTSMKPVNWQNVPPLHGKFCAAVLSVHKTVVATALLAKLAYVALVQRPSLHHGMFTAARSRLSAAHVEQVPSSLATAKHVVPIARISH